MEACVYAVGDIQAFSLLEVNCGVWQTEVKKENKKETVITSQNSLYWLVRVPFGIGTHLEPFKWALKSLFRRSLGNTKSLYLGNISIFDRLLNLKLSLCSQ